MIPIHSTGVYEVKKMARRYKPHLPARTYEPVCFCARLKKLKGKVKPYLLRFCVFVTSAAAGVGLDEVLKWLWQKIMLLF